MILYLFLYRIFIITFRSLIFIASLWNQKAWHWTNGRRKILERLRLDLDKGTGDIIWMHCASLGEFEQGRPVLEALKIRYPHYRILLTFFSPSGYLAVKGNPVADYIYYLPFGSRLVASRFVKIVSPALVLWVKYDYWYYFLHELKKTNTPVLLISGNFMKYQPFFKWYGKLHRRMLRYFKHLFVQTEHSKILLERLGFSKSTTISGDTRFDRVVEIASRSEPMEIIEKFCVDRKVIVAGSTWPEDEEVLDHFANIHPEIKFIIAPHEIDKQHLKYIEKLFKRTIRFSELRNKISEGTWEMKQTTNVLIIDNIGMLSRLYKYASISYVGGGFGEEGIHNVLEPAAYGKPVIFGPEFNKYIEAIELLEEGAGYTIETALELEKVLDDLLSNEIVYAEVCEAAKKYVWSKKGATERILQYVHENLLLTN